MTPEESAVATDTPDLDIDGAVSDTAEPAASPADAAGASEPETLPAPVSPAVPAPDAVADPGLEAPLAPEPAPVAPAPVAPAFGGTAGAVPPASGYVLSPLPPVPPAKGLALASLIVGIGALLLGWLPIAGLVIGGVALGLGIAALRRRQSKGLAIPGIVMGAWGMVSSIITIAVLAVVLSQPAVSDAFWEGFNQGLADEQVAAPVDEPADDEVASDDAPAETPVDVSTAVALDDAAFAALVAEPDASLRQQVVVYGEVQQFDDSTGPCSALVAIDNTEQQSWEGYAVMVWLDAADPASCPEFEGLAALDHLKITATVVGTTTTEWEDGTAEDLLTLQFGSVEKLTPLP